MDYTDPHPTSYGLDPLASGRNHNQLQDPYRPGQNFASPLFSSFGTPMFPLSKPTPYDSFVPYTSEQSEPTTEQYDNLSSDWDQLDMKISRLNLASSHDSEDDSSFLNHTVGSAVGEDMGIANIHQPMVGRSHLAHPGLAPWENHAADNSKFAPHQDMFSRFAYPRGGMEPSGVPNLAGSSFIPPNSSSAPMLGNHLDMHNGPSISAFPRNYPGVNPNNPYPNPLFMKMPQHPAAFSTAPINGAYAEVPRSMGQPTRNNPPSPRKTEPEALPAASQLLNNQTIPTCRYFANGYCSRGDRCNYSHIAPDDKDKDKRVGPPPSARANSRGARPVRAPQVAAPVVEPPAKKLPIDVSRVQTIDQVLGQIYRICKDQHGCRFLQTKLEEKDPHAVDLIFDEVYDHMVELMTDPFGNYLCQKLMEHCNEQQQLLIVQKVAPHLVNISKNMHGTRAVQKMIECLCTASQVALVVNSLKSSVVELIQDLNGNHVIQRCLVKLSIKDNQFVYDAVAANCVAVATHRHGCCVMQRCIDHASQEQQKLQLIREIANNVLVLVKDPFGNYVVQYVLDLPFAMVKVRLIQKFLGHLAVLSTQKFSSNVIEKCLGVADEKVKVQLIDELTQPTTLQCLLQDPYGNYVIQTALSLARPQQRARLVEEIKPLLPALRNTPYGKRIQNLIV